MSICYADSLTPYDNKGEVGMPEYLDDATVLDDKCRSLAGLLKESRCCFVITGAGISTSAGIADFRGPNGVWTLEKEGKPAVSIDFVQAKPTITHLALRELERRGIVKFLVSQNVDGLHPISGFPLNRLAELHGNVFCEHCSTCKRDSVLDWEDALPEPDLSTAYLYAQNADLALCLGTSLQIVPVGDMPLLARKTGGKMVTANLQKTKHEKKADVVIHGKVDDVMSRVLTHMGIPLPDMATAVTDIVETSEIPLEFFEPIKKPRKRQSKTKDEVKEEIKREKSEISDVV